jgi:sugar phosphate isomerase/epimerase
VVEAGRLTVPLPLAVQLYSFRDPARFGGAGMGLDIPTLSAIAAAGYLGVETVDVPGGDAAEARRVLDDLDLAVTSSHTWAATGDRDGLMRAAASIAELGSPRMIVSPSRLTTRRAVDAALDEIGATAEIGRAHGLRLGIHNHSAEMAPVDGLPVIDRFAAALGDAVDFQVDIFWVAVGGADPAEVIRRLGARVVSLHVKDGLDLPSAADAEPFVNVPIGRGVVDPAPAIGAAEAQPSVEWLIVEFDHVEGSAIDAARQSLENLVTRGLARGRNGT